MSLKGCNIHAWDRIEISQTVGWTPGEVWVARQQSVKVFQAGREDLRWSCRSWWCQDHDQAWQRNKSLFGIFFNTSCSSRILLHQRLQRKAIILCAVLSWGIWWSVNFIKASLLLLFTLHYTPSFRRKFPNNSIFCPTALQLLFPVHAEHIETFRPPWVIETNRLQRQCYRQEYSKHPQTLRSVLSVML